MDKKMTLTLLKAFDIGVSQILSDFTEDELLEVPIKTNTNKFFLEDISVLLNRTIKKHVDLLEESNKQFIYFDFVYCLVNTLIDKEIIVPLEETEKEKYKDINERTIMEILLSFMCFSKWKLDSGSYQSFNYEYLNIEDDNLNELKTGLLNAILSKNILMICYCLEQIYYYVVKQTNGLNDDGNIAKKISIIHANNINLNPKDALGFKQHRLTFRESYMRSKGYEIKRLTDERKRKNTQD